jgi:hypothetical protein
VDEPPKGSPLTDSRGRVYQRKTGRPADSPAPYNRRAPAFRVRLTQEERARLDAVADENGVTRTELLRLAVNTFVEDYRDGELIFIRRDMQIASIVRSAD